MNLLSSIALAVAIVFTVVYLAVRSFTAASRAGRDDAYYRPGDEPGDQAGDSVSHPRVFDGDGRD